MKQFRRLLFLLVALIASQIAVGIGTATALTYPAPGLTNLFQFCATDDQEFCIEDTGFLAEGTSSEVPLSGTTGARVWASFAAQYSGPSTAGDQFGFMPRLNISVCPTLTRNGCFETSGTQDGLAAGEYRVRVRLGDYDPTYTVFKGMPASMNHYTISKGADGHFTVEYKLKPQPQLLVYSQEKLAACKADNWGGSCTPDVASRRSASAIIIMSSVAATRERERGFWIASSASYFDLTEPTKVGEEYRQNFSVAAPHFVPSDFGSTNKQENGRNLYPAYYKVFRPYTSITPKVEAFLQAQKITAKVDKQLLDKFIFNDKSPLHQGTIRNPLGVEEKANLTYETNDTGVLIDFNLASFSAPNPTLITRNPLRVPTVRSGATFSPMILASPGISYTQGVLVAPSPGTTVKRVVSLSSNVCVVKSKQVRMLRAGACRLRVEMSVAVVSGKKTSTKTVNTTVTLAVQ